jgi:hypothetical protein
MSRSTMLSLQRGAHLLSLSDAPLTHPLPGRRGHFFELGTLFGAMVMVSGDADVEKVTFRNLEMMLPRNFSSVKDLWQFCRCDPDLLFRHLHINVPKAPLSTNLDEIGRDAFHLFQAIVRDLHAGSGMSTDIVIQAIDSCQDGDTIRLAGVPRLAEFLSIPQNYFAEELRLLRPASRALPSGLAERVLFWNAFKLLAATYILAIEEAVTGAAVQESLHLDEALAESSSIETSRWAAIREEQREREAALSRRESEDALRASRERQREAEEAEAALVLKERRQREAEALSRAEADRQRDVLHRQSALASRSRRDGFDSMGYGSSAAAYSVRDRESDALSARLGDFRAGPSSDDFAYSRSGVHPDRDPFSRSLDPLQSKSDSVESLMARIDQQQAEQVRREEKLGAELARRDAEQSLWMAKRDDEMAELRALLTGRSPSSSGSTRRAVEPAPVTSLPATAPSGADSVKGAVAVGETLARDLGSFVERDTKGTANLTSVQNCYVPGLHEGLSSSSHEATDPVNALTTLVQALNNSTQLLYLPGLLLVSVVGSPTSGSVSQSMRRVVGAASNGGLVWRKVMIYRKAGSTAKSHPDYSLLDGGSENILPGSGYAIMKFISDEIDALKRTFSAHNLAMDLFEVIAADLRSFRDMVPTWQLAIRHARTGVSDDVHLEHMLVFYIFYSSWKLAFSNREDGFTHFDSRRLISGSVASRLAEVITHIQSGFVDKMKLSETCNRLFGWKCASCSSFAAASVWTCKNSKVCGPARAALATAQTD